MQDLASEAKAEDYSFASARARLLVVDDDSEVRRAFEQIFEVHGSPQLEATEQSLFGPEEKASPAAVEFELQCASRGSDAVHLVQTSVAEKRRFSVAFVDVSLASPPDGIETAARIWAVDPFIEIVICTAQDHFAWTDLIRRFGVNDQLLFLRKPFDPTDVQQLAIALCGKWMLRSASVQSLDRLDQAAVARGNALDSLIQRLGQESDARLRMEARLRHAQRFEAMGQLAAGVAHEINTPVQFVGDSVAFLQDAVEDMLGYVRRVHSLVFESSLDATLGDILGHVEEAAQEAELDFIAEELPAAFGRTTEGLSRVTEIVHAMKDSARRDFVEKSPSDVNKALSDTLVMARNEYKYIANVQTQLGELPFVECHIGSLNQVFLNLLINAAHAIESKFDGKGELGLITVSTAVEDSTVVVTIADNGCGIPDQIKSQIYDPFFTTKALGKGTGQGLAICHAIVSDHGGAIECESQKDHGTTFRVRIPLVAQDDNRRPPRHAS